VTAEAENFDFYSRDSA